MYYCLEQNESLCLSVLRNPTQFIFWKKAYMAICTATHLPETVVIKQENISHKDIVISWPTDHFRAIKISETKHKLDQNIDEF